jgi:hypothetical protein
VSSERKAALLRGFLSVSLVVLAVLAALWFGLPGFGRDAEDDGLVAKADPANIDALRNQSGCVVVLQAHQVGNADSKALQKILRELKQERYGNEVRMAEFDVKKYPEIAAQEGVEAGGEPQLSFYIEGQRVGEYRGPWTKPPVQRKIDEILRGYMQRIGRNWRPPVPGMVPEHGGQNIEVRPPEQR